MSYVEEMNLLGGRKIVVGDSQHNLVLANAGSVYVQYGNSYKKLPDLIQDLVEKGVQKGIDDYKAELEAEKAEAEADTQSTDTTQADTSEEVSEDVAEEEETQVDVEQLQRDFDALKQLVTNMATDLQRAGYLISNIDEFEDLEGWITSHNNFCKSCVPVHTHEYADGSLKTTLREVIDHDQVYVTRHKDETSTCPA